MTSAANSVVVPVAAPVVAAASRYATSARPPVAASQTFADTFQKVAEAHAEVNQPEDNTPNAMPKPGTAPASSVKPFPKATPLLPTTEPALPARPVSLKPRATEPATPVLPVQVPKTTGADEQAPLHGHTTPAAAAKTLAAPDDPQPRIGMAPVAAPLTAPPELGIWAFARKGDPATAGEAEGAAKSASARPQAANAPERQVLAEDAALQVRIRLNAEMSPAPLAGPPLKEPLKQQHATADSRLLENGSRESAVELSRKPHPEVNPGELPLRLSHANVSAAALAPMAPEAAHSSGLVAPLVAEGAGQRGQSAATAVPEHKEAAPASSASEVLPERPETTQPLRNLSLEFSPDGANDVRLRVSEHSGEVHISVHSSDPSLSGRLHEGIHDLVGSLSSAGYDAEAWTPSQGRQQQRQPDDSPKKRPTGSSGEGAGAFSGMLQQPTGEVI